MSYPSRHIRPEMPRPFALQPRDRQLLQSVYRHRYLLAEHVHRLHFSDCTLRVAQQRLRRLWEHGYLNRLQVPLQHNAGVNMSPPLYCLARLGAQVVGSDIGIAWHRIPHTPKTNSRGYATLLHNLVATDLLVAAECSNTESQTIVTVRETTLRRQLAIARRERRWNGPALVPDAALMFPRGNNGLLLSRDNTDPLLCRHNTRPVTFYLEVVRAGVRNGNQQLAKKFAVYAKLHYSGFFQIVFGHEHIRAVLFLTTSPERAEHFRQLAAGLPYGRNLFWFGTYQPPPPGRLATVLTLDQLRSAMWRNVDGCKKTLPLPESHRNQVGLNNFASVGATALGTTIPNT